MPRSWFRTRCAAERWLSRRIPLSEGQLWRFENQTDRDARLLIHSVRPDQRAGRIFYVVPFTSVVPVLWLQQKKYSVFPMTEDALRASVTRLLGCAEPVAGVEEDIADFEAAWRADRVGLFDQHSLETWLGFYRQLHKRQPQEYPVISTAAEPSVSS